MRFSLTDDFAIERRDFERDARSAAGAGTDVQPCIELGCTRRHVAQSLTGGSRAFPLKPVPVVLDDNLYAASMRPQADQAMLAARMAQAVAHRLAYDIQHLI